MGGTRSLVAGLIVWAGFNGAAAGMDVRVPILVYHRFSPVARDSMTIRTQDFEAQLRYIADNGYTVISTRELVDYRLGKASPPPAHSVVITADDGHRSIYTQMRPIVLRYRVPVTLFIYPSAISNADYAMTWEQLRELQHTGWFDIQSHTYWHPDFRKERQRLSTSEYRRFVAWQLSKARQTIFQKLDRPVDILAWPFGIYDDDLGRQASEEGYVAAFTLERRPAGASDNLLALPRYLMTSAVTGHEFARVLSTASRGDGDTRKNPGAED